MNFINTNQDMQLRAAKYRKQHKVVSYLAIIALTFINVPTHLISPDVYASGNENNTDAPICSLYGVHDEGSADSQFFAIDQETNTLTLLGPEYGGLDVEASAIHPDTDAWYVISGEDESDTYLHTANGTDGSLTTIGKIVSDENHEFVGATFHPDGTLWAAQEDVGLYTIDLTTAVATLIYEFDGIKDNWEGLSWNLDGTHLYGSSGNTLYQWNPSDQSVATLCEGSSFVPSAIEALEMHPDGRLLGGMHNASAGYEIFEIDINACTIAQSEYLIPNELDDIETFDFGSCELPPVDQCDTNNRPSAVIDDHDPVMTLGGTVTLNGSNSTDPEGDTLTFEWYIEGNTAIYTGSTLDFTPTEAGDYTITLSVKDQCKQDQQTTTITVIENACANNHAPLAVITPENPSITIGESVSFTAINSTDEDSDTLEYLWAVNELSIEETGETFEFTPTEIGEYIVTLTAGDQCSSDTVWTTVTVNPEDDPKVCNLEITKDADKETVFAGDELIYTLTVKNTGTANCTGTGVELEEFYDPQTTFVSSDTTPSHENNIWNFGTVEPGETETVIITVAVSTDALNGDVIHNTACVWAAEQGPYDDSANWKCVSEDTPVIEEGDQCVDNQPPVPLIDPRDQTIILGEEATFTNQSTDGDGDDLVYLWAVNQLGIEATTTDFSFTPTSTGEYIVTLKAADQCTYEVDWTTVNVTEEGGQCPLDNQAPVAIAGNDIEINEGETFTLDATNSTDPDGDTLTYVWSIDTVNFVSNDAVVSTSINDHGTYAATLIVSDSCSEGTDELNITVKQQPTQPPGGGGGGGCSNCGFIQNPPSTPPSGGGGGSTSTPPPPPSSTPEPEPEPEPIVLGESDEFTPPPVSPRAGSGVATEDIVLGLLIGLFATAATYAIATRRKNTLLSINFITSV